MGVITRMLRQTAVYWPPESIETGGDDFDDFGQALVSTGYEIEVRWVDVTEEFIDSNGTRQLSRAKVYVSEDVEVGGILMLGEEADITDLVDIKENEGAWEIRRFEKQPNFKATEFLRTAFL